jgi:hypothetical protein
MKMNDKSFGAFLVAVAIYFLGIIFTFGHAYNAIPLLERQSFGGVEYTVHNGPGTKSVGAFLSSVFWPLYWSAQAWK